jgi:hypothetical protein
MRSRIVIEDIEDIRHRQGINDTELREQVRSLRVGDLVCLTLLSGAAAAGETVPVRITRVRGTAFSGELTRRPALSGLSALRAGSLVVFAAAHIHSLPRGRETDTPSPGAARARHPRQQSSTIGTTVKGPLMKTKTTPPPRPVVLRATRQPLAAVDQLPPASVEDSLERIRAMGERVSGYVEFMEAVGTLGGTSAESKERAVAAFYERMVVLERELGRIAEELQLG